MFLIELVWVFYPRSITTGALDSVPSATRARDVVMDTDAERGLFFTILRDFLPGFVVFSSPSLPVALF